MVPKKGYGIARCLYCGEPFERTGAANYYCCKECRDAAYAETSAVVDAALKECKSETVDGWKPCVICGHLFRPEFEQQKYCSNACRSEGKKRSAENRAKIKRQGRAKKPAKAPEEKKDGFAWADIRKVFAETGITSYAKAVEILKERRKKGEDEWVKEKVSEL